MWMWERTREDDKINLKQKAITRDFENSITLTVSFTKSLSSHPTHFYHLKSCREYETRGRDIKFK